MQILRGAPGDAAIQQRVLAHYRLVASYIAAHLEDTPIVFRNYPDGNLDAAGVFHVTHVPLSVNKLLWLIHAKYAVEFHSWAPLPGDDDRLQFARILLEAAPAIPFERTRLAALAVRALLFDRVKLEAIPLLDGGTGVALWVPLADAPHAAPLRAWLHVLANEAAAKHPDLISTELNTHKDGRVHLHVSSNAAGRFSAVPYSLRGSGLTVATPISWEELGSLTTAAAFTMDNFPTRLETHGDVFGREFAVIKSQRSPVGVPLRMATTPQPRGRVITAAIAILEDGKPRDADEILKEALATALVPPNTTRKYVYTNLIEYIARQLGHGRKPQIVQDAQRRFRINEPPDDWPDLIARQSQPPEDEAASALCERLETTATGDDPTAFETAVCDAFAHLGFLTQHFGQYEQPDGIADAILGTLGYRLTLECKTAKSVVTQPDAVEASKFREPYGAQFSALVGPAFSDETELLTELQTHRVTALAVPELQTLLHLRATPLEIEQLLMPGYASDEIADLLWDRRHGKAKRIATVAALIVQQGWNAQKIAAEQGGPQNAPRVTVDAAMLLVDEALRTAGSTQKPIRKTKWNRPLRGSLAPWLASPCSRPARS
jgi:bifunctional non-homologous end joining protein LigD